MTLSEFFSSAVVAAIVGGIVTCIANALIDRRRRKDEEAIRKKERNHSLLEAAEAIEDFVLDCSKSFAEIGRVLGGEDHELLHRIKSLTFQYPEDIDWKSLDIEDRNMFIRFATEFRKNNQWIVEAWNSGFDISECHEFETQRLTIFAIRGWKIAKEIRKRTGAVDGPDDEIYERFVHFLNTSLKEITDDEGCLIPALQEYFSAAADIKEEKKNPSIARSNVLQKF